MSTTTNHHLHEGKNGSCVDVGEFRRLNYFYGQMLSAQDFQTEQSYFHEKMKLYNRCLHGYGTVCGLLVEPVPMPRECPTEHDEEEKALREKLKNLIGLKAAQLPPTPNPAASASATAPQQAPGVPPTPPPAAAPPAPAAGGPATATPKEPA